MRIKFVSIEKFKILIISIFLVASGLNTYSQELQFGLFADPMISWFKSDTRDSQSEGAKPGFAFGLVIDKYFTENYAFSTGISIINASGRLSYSDTLILQLKNSTSELIAGESINYRIRYLAIPIGIKLKTNQIGYMTYFSNVGLDPKVVIGGKADIPSQDIEGESITEELNMFNLGFHITAGLEYSLGGRTAIIAGLSYEDNFLDITKDNPGQISDKAQHSFVRLRLGINF